MNLHSHGLFLFLSIVERFEKLYFFVGLVGPPLLPKGEREKREREEQRVRESKMEGDTHT